MTAGITDIVVIVGHESENGIRHDATVEELIPAEQGYP
jgi:hypothetical protein